MKKKFLFLIALFGVLFLSFFVSASYVTSRFQSNSPGLTTSFLGSTTQSDVNFNSEVCNTGQDFIVRIVPGGCTPPVVRSDLLEEQSVPVYCRLQALKVNPLITVTSIESISFGANSLPKGVSSVGFVPNYPALGIDTQLGNGKWNDIGYAVIFLNQNAKESSIPESVSGELSATIRYTVTDSFGLQNYQFYLPTLTDLEFSERLGQYAFFNHMGYLRADDIQPNSASISIYSGLNEKPLGGSSGLKKQKILNYNLDVGKSSPNFFLPGFGCLATSSLRLDSVQGQDTRAVIKINSEIFEVGKGEYFYDNKCQVTDDPIREGLRETVSVTCAGDDKRETFNFRIEPKITLMVDGKEKELQVGDSLGYVSSDSPDKNVYLGYVGTKPGTIDGLKNSLVYLVAVPGEKRDKLDAETLSAVAKYAELDLKKDSTAGNIISSFLGYLSKGWDWLVNGKNVERLDFGNSKGIFGKEVQITSFAVGTNLDLKNQTLIGYKSNAVKDYEQIRSTFAAEKYPSNSQTQLGEEALYQLINLSDKLEQNEDLKKYCDLFETKYSDSDFDDSVCKGIPSYSNIGFSKQTILMDGDYKEVSFEGVHEPSFDEYGIVLNIRKGEKVLDPIKLEKGDLIYLGSLFSSSTTPTNQQNQTSSVQGTGSDQEYLQLNEIGDKNSANLKFHLQNRSSLGSLGTFLSSPSSTLKINVPYNPDGTDYTFIITKINLENVAKVSVHTRFRDTSKINFNFTLGIEKRAIQLSPEETKNRIKSWTNRVNAFKSISDNLGKVVNVFEAACKATGAILTIKNLISNSGTEALARKNVMSGEGGWNSFCESQVNKKYSTKEQCLFDNSDTIEKQVGEISKEMDRQNEELQKLQEIEGVTASGGLFGQDVVNQNALMEKGYSDKLKQSLDSLNLGSTFSNPEKPEEKVDLSIIKESLDSKNLGVVYSFEDAKQIELYANLASQNPKDLIYKKRLYTLLKGVEENGKSVVTQDGFLASYGLKSGQAGIISTDKDLKEISVGNLATFSQVKDRFNTPMISVKDEKSPFKEVDPENLKIKGEDFIYLAKDKSNANQYLLVLDKDSVVQRTFKMNGKDLTLVENSVNPLKLKFKKVDTTTGTPITNPVLKYYETDPYKGLPAVIPVQSKNGWYAYVPQTLASTASSSSYALSGRINSFWMCNVGSNGVMEYNPRNDNCQFINLGNSNTYSQISGLSSSDSIKLVNTAVKNIETASRAYKSGIQNVGLEDGTYNVGSPAFDNPIGECTDVMSAKDCQILFNACDPVICPSSRCDFGGEYPVQNVIQSGVVGSVALCLPNINEGIYVPVCLTGVKAGIDNFISIGNSYVECLNTSLETGKTTGICDEINSIYICELVWRQVLPLTNLAIPKIDSLIFGTSSARNGVEYTGGIQGALDNAKNSADYLVQYYSLNANSAFKARSQEEVGSLVCKNFLSVVYPQGQGALEALTQSKSPPQFTAKFDVIPFSSATNPPQVQYKVFYHIFAGNDQGAYYRVYLKGDGSSYFQDSSISLNVDSGYIAPGDYETQTKDFSANEGYKELCVQVNNQEECGFGTVSTDFAVQYLGDQYVKDQALTRNITSQGECQSGSPNLAALLNPNLEAGVSNTVSPNLANQGITRICGGQNPGIGSDQLYPGPNQRWMDVGYCDDVKTRCWLDTKTLSQGFNFQTTANKTLEELGNTLKENLAKQNNLFTDADFENVLKNISKSKTPEGKLSLIEKAYLKTFGNNQKGYLLLLHGNIYRDLAFGLFDELVKDGTLDLGNKNNDSVPKAENQFKDYISNVYNYVESNPDGSHLYNYCYQFRSGVWYRSQKEGSSCGSLDTVSTGSVVNGQGFLEGFSKLLERVKNNPEGSSLSAGSYVVGAGDFEFLNILTASQNYPSEKIYLRFEEKSNSWSINLGDGEGFILIDDSLSSKLISEGPTLTLSLNLTDKDLNQGALVLFEGKGFNFKEKTISSSQPEKLDKGTIDLLNSIEPFVLQTNSQSDYDYSFSYLVGKGWYVKNTYYLRTTVSGEPSSSEVTSAWMSINSNDFSDNQQYSGISSLLKTLNGKNFLDGFKEIIVSSSGTLNSGKFSFLKNDKSSVTPNGILKISNLESVGDLYFIYNYHDNGKWLYGYDGTNWNEVTGNLPPKHGKTWIVFNKDYPMTQSEETLVKSLSSDKKSQLDGTVAIFLYANPPPANDINSDSGGNPGTQTSPQGVSSKSSKVLQAAQDLNGKIADSSEFCSVKDGGVNCYTAIKNVYLKAGLDLTKDLVRIYSSGKSARLKDGTRLEDHQDISYYIGDPIDSGLTETQKLSLLIPGDKIDIAYLSSGKWVVHSVIFIGWTDKINKRAKVFDWNGALVGQGKTDALGTTCTSEKFYPGSSYCKTYRYNEISLKNEDNYVYHIRAFT